MGEGYSGPMDGMQGCLGYANSPVKAVGLNLYAFEPYVRNISHLQSVFFGDKTTVFRRRSLVSLACCRHGISSC